MPSYAYFTNEQIKQVIKTVKLIFELAIYYNQFFYNQLDDEC